MTQRAEMNYRTVAEGGRMDDTEMNYRTVAEGGRMDDTTCRNELSNSGRGREDECHKRQKEIQREDGCHKRQK